MRFLTAGVSSITFRLRLFDAPSLINMTMRSPRARAMDAAEETMAGLDAAAEDAMGGIGDSAPLLSDTSLEDAAGEFLLRLQRQTGIPAAALLPLILSLSSIAVILLCQALFALLVRVAFGDARRGGAHSNGSVLLLGVCGAGKTALFQTLRSGSPYLTTVTSMEANDATILMEGKTRKSGVVAKKLRVVDLPGHPRLGGLLETHVRSARSAVFVIDAVDFASRRREIAERLFHALQTIAKAKGRAARTFPLIVACNKSEKITAHPIAFIKSRLEKEMDALLRTAGSLAETGSKGDDRKDAANRGDAEMTIVARRTNDKNKNTETPIVFQDANADVSFSAVSVAENDLDELKSHMVVR